MTNITDLSKHRARHFAVNAPIGGKPVEIVEHTFTRQDYERHTVDVQLIPFAASAREEQALAQELSQLQRRFDFWRGFAWGVIASGLLLACQWLFGYLHDIR